MSFKNAILHVGCVSPEDYHNVTQKRGDADYPMSPSALKEFGRCPSRWVAGYVSPESKSKDWGSLVDCLVLTPALLPERYAVHPTHYDKRRMECPQCKSVTDSKACKACKCDRVEKVTKEEWSWQSNTCQAWAEANKGKAIISPALFESAKQAATRLLADPVAREFAAQSSTQVLVTGEWHDEATKLVVPVRCLIDLVPDRSSEFAKSLGDLKTTRNAALLAFNRDVFANGYHIQAAFDLDLYVAATGEDRCNWCFLVSENFPPYEPAKRLMSESYLTLGRHDYTTLLRTYCRCLKAGHWPGYDDTDESVQGWGLCEPSPWMESQTAFAPKFEAVEAGEPEPVNEEEIVP